MEICVDGLNYNSDNRFGCNTRKRTRYFRVFESGNVFTARAGVFFFVERRVFGFRLALEKRNPRDEHDGNG